MAVGAVLDATPSQYIHMHTLNKLLEKNAWVTPMATGAVVDATPSQYNAK